MRPKQDVTKRFWSKVNKDGPIPPHMPHLGKCWVFAGSPDTAGYGRMRVHGVQKGAHRVSWLLHHGEPAPGLQVLHHCDNPPCVNPSHLFLGTARDNANDRDRKNRNLQLSRPRARLSDSSVAELRRRFAAGESMRALGLAFEIKKASVWNLVTRRTRRTLQDLPPPAGSNSGFGRPSTDARVGPSAVQSREDSAGGGAFQAVVR